MNRNRQILFCHQVAVFLLINSWEAVGRNYLPLSQDWPLSAKSAIVLSMLYMLRGITFLEGNIMTEFEKCLFVISLSQNSRNFNSIRPEAGLAR